MTHLRPLHRPLACGLVFAAAGLAAAEPLNPSLRDTSWRLETLDGIAPPAATGEDVKLRFDAKSQHLSGQACNRLQGRFTQRGTQLALSPVAATRKACPAEAFQREQHLLQVLAATDAYRIEGDRLSLLRGDAVHATFRAVPAVRK